MSENTSILLALDGSEEALYAAELCRYLAAKISAKVVPIHVIEKTGALEFIAPPKAGLIGSGPYMLAYESLCLSLKEISDKLSDSYSAKFSESSENLLFEEGSPLEKLCERAPQHSLIVTGYNPRALPTTISHLHAKLTLVEQLAHQCARPLMVVRRPINEILELTAVTTDHYINPKWLKNCWLAARQMGIPFTISLLPLNDRIVPNTTQFMHRLIELQPEFYQVTVRILPKKGSDHISNVVPILPTIVQDEHRVTPSGECPAIVLRTSQYDSVIFWPDQATAPLFGEAAATSAAR